MNIDWVKIDDVEDIPLQPQVLLIAIPTWNAAGKWKGYVIETAFFDGLRFETESDTFNIDDVSHYSPILPPKTPVTVKNGR